MADESVVPAEPVAAAEPAAPTSFADAAQADQPQFTQAALDAKLADGRKAWEAEQAKTYGWIPKDFKPEDGQEALGIYGRMNSDSIGLARDILYRAGQDPRNADAIRAYIGALLPGGGTAAPDAAVPRPAAKAEPPAPDLFVPGRMGEDGRVIPDQHVYSASGLQKLMEFERQQQQAAFDERLKPVLDWKTQQEKASQHAEADQQADRLARNVIGSLSKRPMFEEHRSEIAAEIDRIAKAEFNGTIPDEQIAAVARDAYLDVVLPKLGAQGQTAALAEHARKAGAGTARPGGGAAATPREAPVSWSERLRTELKVS